MPKAALPVPRAAGRMLCAAHRQSRVGDLDGLTVGANGESIPVQAVGRRRQLRTSRQRLEEVVALLLLGVAGAWVHLLHPRHEHQQYRSRTTQVDLSRSSIDSGREAMMDRGGTPTAQNVPRRSSGVAKATTELPLTAIPYLCTSMEMVVTPGT